MPYNNEVAQKAYQAEHYRKNREAWRGRQRAARVKAREFVRGLKKGKRCVRCGYDDVRALVHHHVSGVKDAPLKRAAADKWSERRILEEVAKCELLCANCHAIEHFSEV